MADPPATDSAPALAPAAAALDDAAVTEPAPYLGGESALDESALAHEDYQPPIPSPLFQQAQVECVPASALLALYLWDREDNTTRRLQQLTTRVTPGLQASHPAHAQALQAVAGQIQSGGISTFQQGQYRTVSAALYDLFNTDGAPALSKSERTGCLQGMGFPFEPKDHIPCAKYDDLWLNPVSRLVGRQIAQVIWRITTSGFDHAFLIGRLTNGHWFLYDQGVPYYNQQPGRDELRLAVRQDCQDGFYHLDLVMQPDSRAGGAAILREPPPPPPP